jgi:hypothetical protein
MGFIQKSIASAAVMVRELKMQIVPNKCPRKRLHKFLDHLDNDPDIWVARLRRLLKSLPDDLVLGCIEKQPLALLTVFNADDFVLLARAADVGVLNFEGSLVSKSHSDAEPLPAVVVQDHLMKLGMFAAFVMHGKTNVTPNGNEVSASLTDIFILIENSFGDRVSRSAWFGERVN